MPKPDESVQRLLIDPMWLGATDAELAEEARTSVKHVRRVKEAELRGREVYAVLTKAREMALQRGYTGRVWDLISDALEAY